MREGYPTSKANKTNKTDKQKKPKQKKAKKETKKESQKQFGFSFRVLFPAFQISIKAEVGKRGWGQ